MSKKMIAMMCMTLVVALMAFAFEVAVFTEQRSYPAIDDSAAGERAETEAPEPAGTSAFKLPSSLQIIEDEAFAGTALTQVDLPDTLQSIGERAFADIPTLRTIVIPGKTTQIAKGAFEGSDHVLLIGEFNSSAREYARENGIPFSPFTAMYAHADSAQSTASAASRRNDTESAAVDTDGESEQSNQWRTIGEPIAIRQNQFHGSRHSGRAPPIVA